MDSGGVVPVACGAPTWRRALSVVDSRRDPKAPVPWGVLLRPWCAWSARLLHGPLQIPPWDAGHGWWNCPRSDAPLLQRVLAALRVSPEPMTGSDGPRFVDRLQPSCCPRCAGRVGVGDRVRVLWRERHRRPLGPDEVAVGIRLSGQAPGQALVLAHQRERASDRAAGQALLAGAPRAPQPRCAWGRDRCRAVRHRQQPACVPFGAGGADLACPRGEHAHRNT